MADILTLYEAKDPKDLLQTALDQSKDNGLDICVIITKRGTIFEVSTSKGSCIERAGMCAYAQKIILESLEEI